MRAQLTRTSVLIVRAQHDLWSDVNMVEVSHIDLVIFNSNFTAIWGGAVAQFAISGDS
jgi:hypothetical protein